jgi:hypothetical protein
VVFITMYLLKSKKREILGKNIYMIGDCGSGKTSLFYLVNMYIFS